MKLKMFCGLMLFITLSIAAPLVHGAAAVSASHAGTASMGVARQVLLDALPQVTAPTSRLPRVIPDRGDDAINLNAPAQRNIAPAQTYGLAASPRLPQSGETPAVSQSYVGEDESACGFFIPSDHALAASQFYVVQVLNSCIDIHLSSNSAHESGYPKSLTTFFGVAGGDLVGDPRALFDWKGRRFIVVAEDFTTNSFLVAASQTLNPKGVWNIYNISANAGGVQGCADFPMLGQTVSEIGDSKGAIYLSWDRFACGGGFVDDVVWILPKTAIYSGAGFGFSIWLNFNLGGVTLDHIQPANVIVAGDMPASEFMVNDLDFNHGCGLANPCNGLVVWSFHNGIPTSSAPISITGVFIGTANNYVQPRTVSQPGAPSGTACAINAGPVGITGDVSWSAGDLYAATTTGALNGAAADGMLIWQIHPTLDGNGNITGATMRDEICQGCGGGFGNGGSEFYPTVQPDDEGNITVVFNYSDNGTNPSTAFLSKRTTQAAGTLNDGGIFLAVGAHNYCQIDGSGRNRWGDYTASSNFGLTAQHPAFWFSGQFVEASGNWGTVVGKNGYFNPTQP